MNDASPTFLVIAPIPDLCYGPRYAATWHANARQLTTSRVPRDEALRNSATPTGGSGPRMQIEDGKFGIRNSKSEIAWCGSAEILGNGLCGVARGPGTTQASAHIG